MISEISAAALIALGQRLRTCRLQRNEPQAMFAARLGVSVPTLRAMEQGLPTTRIGHWAEALWQLERLGELDALLAERADLFAQSETPPRQRARRRR